MKGEEIEEPKAINTGTNSFLPLDIKDLAKLIFSKKVIFFTGAGISMSKGIPNLDEFSSFTNKLFYPIEEVFNEILAGETSTRLKMTYGEMNIVYDIQLPDQEIIFRANDITIPLEGTENSISILSKLGLPVPNVLHADVTKSVSFCLYHIRKIPKEDLRYELPKMSLQMAVIVFEGKCNEWMYCVFIHSISRPQVMDEGK